MCLLSQRATWTRKPPGGPAVLQDDDDGLQEAGVAPAPSCSRPVTRRGVFLWAGRRRGRSQPKKVCNLAWFCGLFDLLSTFTRFCYLDERRRRVSLLEEQQHLKTTTVGFKRPAWPPRRHVRALKRGEEPSFGLEALRTLPARRYVFCHSLIVYSTQISPLQALSILLRRRVNNNFSSLLPAEQTHCVRLPNIPPMKSRILNSVDMPAIHQRSNRSGGRRPETTLRASTGPGVSGRQLGQRANKNKNTTRCEDNHKRD
ncbi:hypothetical protein BDZ89DRAFT_403748 [Hymenopellis radicata]|nr:hypothetical protein BDZ89DRAFT_403748 [Hymenopellis radicata]